MPAHFDLTMADGRQPVVALVIDNRATAMVASALVRQFGGGSWRRGADAMLALRIARVGVVSSICARTMDGFAAAASSALAAHRAVPVVRADRRATSRPRAGVGSPGR